MRRLVAASTIAAAAAGLLLALPNAPAWGKGSEFEPDLPAYAPGEIASLRVVFGRGSYDGKLADGPFYGYLVRYPRWFSPGPIPVYAIPLGPVHMRVANGPRCCFVAKMDFVVPSVPDGAYAIQYCNDPCTVSGVGDLEPSPFWIGKSALEFRIDELDSALLESRRRLTDTRRRLHGQIDHLLARTRMLAGRVEALEARAAAVAQEPAREEGDPALAMVTATTAAVLAGSLVALRGVPVRRGRRPARRESRR